MRKAALLFVLMVMVFMVGCAKTSTATMDEITTDLEDVATTTEEISGMEDSVLDLEPRGIYNMSAFGSRFKVYRFEGTEIVVYQIGDDIYLVGDDAGEHGNSYADIFVENAKFEGISDNYLLFLTTDLKEEFGIAIKETENLEIGESLHEKVPYGELYDAGERFCYVKTFEEVKNPY